MVSNIVALGSIAGVCFFCVEFPYSHCVGVGPVQVVGLFPTVQKTFMSGQLLNRCKYSINGCLWVLPCLHLLQLGEAVKANPCVTEFRNEWVINKIDG